MHISTLKALCKAQGLNQSALARALGVTRQAVSVWFRAEEAVLDIRSRHLKTLSEVFGVPPDKLLLPLPCSNPAIQSRFVAALLWDRLYPGLEDFAIALARFERRAIARLVQVYGIFYAESVVGKRVWSAFPKYKEFIQPRRRKDLEILWKWVWEKNR